MGFEPTTFCVASVPAEGRGFNPKQVKAARLNAARRLRGRQSDPENRLWALFEQQL